MRTEFITVEVLALTFTYHQHIAGPELSSFAFLTSRYLLIAVQPALELDEDNIIQGPNTPLLAIIDIEAAPSDTVTRVPFSDIEPICTFHYPELSDPFAVVAMSVRSDPAPYWSPNPALRVPFSVAREDRLLVVTLWVLEGNIPLGILSLIPASTLLGALASLDLGSGVRVTREFRWAEWGPRGSRLMSIPGAHSPVWVCYVYGTTYALWGPDGGGMGKAVYTLDFNQLAIRRALVRNVPDDIMVHPIVFKPAGVFKEEVRTALPYRARKLAAESLPEGEGNFEAVMVAEDALVLVSDVSVLLGVASWARGADALFFCCSNRMSDAIASCRSE